MPFDAAKFEAAKLAPRHKTVKVDELQQWFGPDEPAVWEVRGLSGIELHKALDAEKRQSSVESIIKAISNGGDQVKAMREALGLSDATPGEVAKRLEMLVMGSVVPKIDLTTAARLAEHFPFVFLELTNEISFLTGKGSDLVKPEAASQPTPA